ncbi:unnamed protein product [Calypogeia fissa]
MAGQNGKPMPMLDQQSTRELNLTVLQRMDRHVEDILTTAAHVTFYEFNVELSQWSRKDVEGSLFVVKRRTQPRFQFIVMNRRSTDNLVEDLLGDFEYEVQVPYLLYRNAAQEVNGIWFYNSRECEEVAKLFSRILNAFSKHPPKPKLYSSQSSEFQELEGGPTAALVDGPLEPSAPTPAPSAGSDHPDETLEQFFRNVTHLGSPESASLSARLQTVALPSSTLSPSITSSNLTPLPVPSLSPSTSGLAGTPMAPPLSLELPDYGGTVLLKPSFFVPPPLSSAPAVPTHVPTSIQLQPSHGAPLLQPFPPPAPPPSLAPPASITQGIAITKDGVRDALFRLVQSDHFIDMVYGEMLNAHNM